jgi:hypothetical protein
MAMASPIRRCWLLRHVTWAVAGRTERRALHDGRDGGDGYAADTYVSLPTACMGSAVDQQASLWSLASALLIQLL